MISLAPGCMREAVLHKSCDAAVSPDECGRPVRFSEDVQLPFWNSLSSVEFHFLRSETWSCSNLASCHTTPWPESRLVSPSVTTAATHLTSRSLLCLSMSPDIYEPGERSIPNWKKKPTRKPSQHYVKRFQNVTWRYPTWSPSWRTSKMGASWSGTRFWEKSNLSSPPFVGFP